MCATTQAPNIRFSYVIRTTSFEKSLPCYMTARRWHHKTTSSPSSPCSSLSSSFSFAVYQPSSAHQARRQPHLARAPRRTFALSWRRASAASGAREWMARDDDPVPVSGTLVLNLVAHTSDGDRRLTGDVNLSGELTVQCPVSRGSASASAAGFLDLKPIAVMLVEVVGSSCGPRSLRSSWRRCGGPSSRRRW